MALLKEAAAEGGSLGNLDCWEGLSSGRAWEAGQGWKGLKSPVHPVAPLPQSAFGSGALEEDAQSSRLSWKTRSSGCKPSGMWGPHPLEERPSKWSKVQGSSLTGSECPILGGRQAKANIGRACWKRQARVC